LKGFIDTQCGFKCFRREKVLPVFKRLKIDRFSFDVELLFVAQKHRLKIKEVPVEWKNVLFSRVRIIRDSTQMLIDLFRIRFNAMRGIYD
jgi:dolichyl-phosphate beta-glucosyltransferase